MAGSGGPAVQLGADVDISSSALLNANLKWNNMSADLESGGIPLTRLQVDPLSLGVGVGFRF
jgi:outer membrane protein W